MADEFARLRLRLPARMYGSGLRDVADMAPAACWYDMPHDAENVSRNLRRRFEKMNFLHSFIVFSVLVLLMLALKIQGSRGS